MNQPPPGQPQEQPQKKGMSTCLIVGIVLAVISVPVLGIMAALGIYGVRRYLSAAKTAEAKATVTAISRAAVAAYERETPDPDKLGAAYHHALCTSASPVPARVPAAVKYVPSSASGADFDAGSATAGWKCLKFAMTMPMYYQYHYVKGAGWIVPSTAPGKDGFEAAARGDLDGNGTFSTFSRTGRVQNGVVVLATELHVENEFE